MCDWSNECTLKFLELYQNEPVIWDPMHLYHKDRKQINDAWVRLSGQLECPVTELKKKKDSVMATFRGHLRKKKASIKSGAGANDIYKPIWFAYEYMESFLSPVYECQTTINTQDTERIDDLCVSVKSNALFCQPQSKKPKSSTKSVTQQNELLSLACGYLSKQDTKEDSDLHLAKVWTNKLKCLDPNQRLYAEKAINDILFEAQLRTLHRNSIQINESSLSS